MRSKSILIVVGLFTVLALIPAMAFASGASRQQNKNLWRNLAIGSGVVAGYGLLKHNSTATLVGAAGAGYSLYRYEQDRKSQDAAKRARARYWYRHHYLRYHRTSRYHRTMSYHRTYAPTSYVRNGRKYYTYDGHRYYEQLSTGLRHRVY